MVSLTDYTQQLQTELDAINREIAQRLSTGADVSDLQRQGAEKVAALANVPNLERELEARSKIDQREKAIASYHRLKQQLETARAANSAIRRKIAPLEKKLAPALLQG